MKLVATKKADQNRAVFDPWSVVHFAAGLASGLIELPRRVALPLSILYEVLEYRAELEDFGQELFETSGPEAVPNAVVDVAIFALGHELGRRWNRLR